MDTFRVVYRGYDPVELDLVEEMLSARGLRCRRLGRANPALLGVGNSAVEQIIEVEAADLEAARGLLESIPPAEADTADPEQSSGDTPEDEEEGSDERPPGAATADANFLLCFGLGLMFPGLALAYAGLLWAGMAFALWACMGFVLTVTVSPVAAALGHVAVRIAELLCSQFKLRSSGRRASVSALAQILVVFVLMSVVTWLKMELGPTANELLLPDWRR